MVEVFKTNITNPTEAEQLLQKLNGYYPQSKINFDLEDCDNILRFEGQHINANQIIHVVKSFGYVCDVLE